MPADRDEQIRDAIANKGVVRDARPDQIDTYSADQVSQGSVSSQQVTDVSDEAALADPHDTAVIGPGTKQQKA